MARNLVQLVELQISGCRTMEEIISINESDEKHMMDMFSNLHHLKLEDLPILTGFCSRSYTGNPSLEILQLENDKEIEERDSREEFGNALFDEKVVFPSLKRLVISGLTKIMTIWQNQLSLESFRNLEILYIKSCQSLKSVFPSSMVTSLEQLMELEVDDCGVEEIVANEDGVQATHEFVFPKVDYVGFHNLPHLYCFYRGMHASWWPSLENLRDSFPSLKKVVMFGMEIWEGPFPVNFFSKLEYFQEANQHSESAAILEKFPNAVGALPHLTHLWLDGMSKLMHLGKDNSQLAGQNFPNLTFLGIDGCVNLRNLRSSTISFKNLTELQVNGCSGLEYLLNYSTAKSLMQLRVLSVEDCAKMVEIFGSTKDENDSRNEIVFSRLKYLELSKLPRLQGFCSRDCIVKFPLLETLYISKRLKLKIFHNDQTLQITDETDDTDVDADDDGEKARTKENVGKDTSADGEQIVETTDIKNVKNDENYDEPEHVQPHKNITANDQGVIAPVEENLAIVPVGEITTPVIPVTEPHPLVAELPHIGEVGEQAFSGPNLEPPAEEARPNEHQTPKAPEQLVEEQSDPFEPSAAATETPTPKFRSLAPQSSLKLSEEKRSLREKLQALSAKKAATSSCMPEEAKAKLKALIATADLKDPHTRQQLLAVLPTLQLSSTKWIADLVVQELSKLPLVLDKEESLCHELAALKAQGFELDEKSHILLGEGSLAEESIEKVQEQKVELLALEEKIKKLEAQATSLRDEIAIAEKRYSGFEASLDQLFEEQKLNHLSVDSTSQELLRTRAVSDSLCTAIFTHLCQLF